MGHVDHGFTPILLLLDPEGFQELKNPSVVSALSFYARKVTSPQDSRPTENKHQSDPLGERMGNRTLINHQKSPALSPKSSITPIATSSDYSAGLPNDGMGRSYLATPSKPGAQDCAIWTLNSKKDCRRRLYFARRN